MPSTSKKQQRFFGLVHLVQQGKIKAPSANIQKAADSMSEGDVNDYAKTKHNKLAALIKKAVLDDQVLQGLGGNSNNPLAPKLEISGMEQGVKRFTDGLRERAAKDGKSPLDFADQEAIQRFVTKIQREKAFGAAAGGVPAAPLFPQAKVAALLEKLGK